MTRGSGGKPPSDPADAPGKTAGKTPARTLGEADPQAGGAGASRRLYFDLTDGQTTLRDEEGVEATDLGFALKAAWAVLQETKDHGEGWSLVIRDADGKVHARLPVP